MNRDAKPFPPAPSNAFLRLTLAADRSNGPMRARARAGVRASTGVRLANGSAQRVQARRPHSWGSLPSQRPPQKPQQVPQPQVLFMPTDLIQKQRLSITLEQHPGPQHQRLWSISLDTMNRRPDLLVVGLDQSSGRGLKAYCQLQEQAGDTPILVLIRNDQEYLGRDAVKLGAVDFIPARQLAGPILGLCLRHILRHQLQDHEDQDRRS